MEAANGVEPSQDVQSSHLTNKNTMQPDSSAARMDKTLSPHPAITPTSEPSKVCSPVPDNRVAGPPTTVWISLYLSEQSDLDDPAGFVPLTNTDTRGSLFTLIDDDLRGELENDDTIVAVKIKRADDQVIAGTPRRTIPVKRAGQSDTWRSLAASCNVSTWSRRRWSVGICEIK